MDESKLVFAKALEGTYKTKKESADMMAKSNYILDSELSNIQSRAYFNKDENKLLITYRGTKNLINDVPTDISILLGTLKNTDRYKSSKKLYDKAKEKYNPSQTTIIGDSLGGSLASEVGRTSNDQVLTFNKGAGLLEPLTMTKTNEKSYRWKGDIVSGLSIFNKNQHTIGDWKPPLVAHNYENLNKLRPIYL